MLREPVIIYVFSGSGNTWTVAREIADVFLDGGVSTELRPLERSAPEDSAKAGTLGLAFPVAMFTAYPFVWKFIEALPDGRGKRIFMVDTLAGFSGGIVGPLKRALSQKGYRPIGAKEIRMPSNYSRKEPEGEKDAQIRAKGLKKAASFARDLISGSASWRSIPILSDIIKEMGYRSSGAAWRSARKKFPLATDGEKCSRCGLCEQLCPVGNITMSGLPVFGDTCVFCQRCISFCPGNAISVVGKPFVPYRGMEPAALLEFLGIR
ncbi:MAG: EFR1 family ferrodoxin [Thermovirgaceae bacterium]|nr:EFR1 family ferrodoxin [Thermovirgaceae bacterium]